MKIGTCNWTFPALSRPSCCGRLAAVGIKSILLEFGSVRKNFPLSVSDNIAAWVRETQKFGIEIDGVSVRSTKEHGFKSELGKYALDLAVETAKRLRARSVCVPCNRNLASIEAEGAFDTVAETLRRLCRKAIPQGIIITTENNLSATESGRLLEAVGEPNVRLCLDPCNYVLDKGWLPAGILPGLLPLADIAIHFKDGLNGRGSIRPLGQGEGRMAEITETLGALKFGGTAIMENIYMDKAFTPKGQDPFLLLEEDVKYVVNALG